MKNEAYFLVEDDLDLVGRWHLNGLRDQMGREFDSRVFTYGNYVELSSPLMLPSYKDGENCEAAQPVCVPLRKSGRSLDFTFADFDMPVLSERAANVLVEAVGSAVQRIPAVVESTSEQFQIANIVSRVDCIDASKSEIKWFEVGNNIRPDLAGTPEMITKLRIDPQRTGGRHIFRLQGWKIAIVVSDSVKAVLENARITGIKYSCVTE